ncbi:MAG: YitT family protein [Candidatus Cryptobacteroides sp.]
MTLKRVLPHVWDYIVLTFGTLLYCLAWDSFMIPNNISSGGLTGACTILQYATLGAIPMSWSFFVLNVLLLITGFIVLGKGFGIKTVYVVLLSSVLFEILPEYDFLKAIPGNFLYIDNRLLVPIVGGILESIGIGLIILRGGSTGGTDIAVLIVNKFWPVSPGKVYLYSDLVIIASVLLVPGKGFEDMIFGYIAMITFSFMLDFVLLGNKTTFQVMVFSEKYEEIADFILKRLDRGVTALKAVGWYTRKDKNVLLILVRKPQIRELTKAIKEIDSKAFVSVSPATSVYGEGFDEIKTGIGNKLKKDNDSQVNVETR